MIRHLTEKEWEIVETALEHYRQSYVDTQPPAPHRSEAWITGLEELDESINQILQKNTKLSELRSKL